MATTHVLARSSRSSLCVDLLHQASALRMHPRLGQPLVARSQQRLAQRANGAKRPPREAAPERFLLCVCYNLARGPCTLTTRTSGPARCAACAALHCSVCRLTCRRVSFSDADSCTACWAHQGCACCFPSRLVGRAHGTALRGGLGSSDNIYQETAVLFSECYIRYSRASVANR